MDISDIRIVDDERLHIVCEGETIVLPGLQCSEENSVDFIVDKDAAEETRPEAFEEHAYARWLAMLPEVAFKHGLRIEFRSVAE